MERKAKDFLKEFNTELGDSNIYKSIVMLNKLLFKILSDLGRLQKLERRRPTPTEIKAIISTTFKGKNSSI